MLSHTQLPPRLAVLMALDATNPDDWPRVIERLCEALQRPPPGASPRPSCPYPGMKQYEEADSGRFFGREREVEELTERLRVQPFQTVIGPSGSGKSSLVFAGLIPSLRKSGLFGNAAWLVRTIRPGVTPLQVLASAIGSDLTHPIVASDIEALLAREQGTRQFLLIVDQFEELFTTGTADAVPFQQAVLALAQLPGCYVILTVRADFYPELMVSPAWSAIRNGRYEVLPLDTDGMHQAITRPAEQIGVFIESALVERLVLDASGQPGALPLIQETLVLLWERLQRRFLPLSAYEILVLPLGVYKGVGGSKSTGLQVALAHKADATLGTLTPAEQRIARGIMLRLVHFGEGRADTRRQQSTTALRIVSNDPDAFDRTLEVLTRGRLLTRGQDATGTPVVDIAHETLIAAWPELQRWIAEGRADELKRRRITTAANEWIERGHESSDLYRSTRLAEAIEWAAANSADVSTQVESFLQASRQRARAFRIAKIVAIVAVCVLASILPLFQVRDKILQQAASGQTVPLAAGMAWLGSDTADEHTSPAQRVPVSAFTLNTYEVTYRQYRLCVNAGRCTLLREPSDEHGFAGAPENMPIIWVDAYQAATFCSWIGRDSHLRRSGNVLRAEPMAAHGHGVASRRRQSAQI